MLPLRRAVRIAGELLLLIGVLVCVPAAILAIGIPVALFVRLLLWIGAALL